MPNLEVMNGRAAGQSLHLDGNGEWILGTRRSAALTLRDRGVAFTHAIITGRGGDYEIKNRADKSQTLVNGQSVGRGMPLRDGDTITLGTTELRFTDDAPAAPAAATERTASAPQQPPAEAQPDSPFEPIPAAEHTGGTVSVSEINQLREEKAQTQANLDALRQAVAAREGSLAQAQSRVRELEAQLSGQGEPPEVARLRAQIDELTAKAKARIDDLTRRNELLKLQVTHAGGAVPPPPPPPDLELEGKVSELRARMRELEADKDELEARLAAASADAARLAASEAKVQELQAQLGTPASDEVDALQALIAELNTEKAALQRDRTQALETIASRDRQLETLTTQLERAREEAAAPGDAARVTVLEERLDASQARARELEDKLNAASERPSEEFELARRVEALTQEVETLRTSEAEARQEAAELRQDLEDINEDMLAQGDELQARIDELEAKLGERKDD